MLKRPSIIQECISNSMLYIAWYFVTRGTLFKFIFSVFFWLLGLSVIRTLRRGAFRNFLSQQNKKITARFAHAKNLQPAATAFRNIEMRGGSVFGPLFSLWMHRFVEAFLQTISLQKNRYDTTWYKTVKYFCTCHRLCVRVCVRVEASVCVLFLLWWFRRQFSFFFLLG